MKSILRRHSRDLALIVGNGVNRHGPGARHDWKALLQELALKHLQEEPEIPEGVALTEYFDFLELRSDKLGANQLQKEFCDLLKGWTASEQHKRIVQWATAHEAPILTTNFDNTLSAAGECGFYSLFRPGPTAKQPTDYYPWESYYGHRRLTGPCDGFGIWHINGLQRYPRSVRLSLTHYMGSVARAREWIHSSADSSIFSGKNMEGWRGRNTWLHIVFNKSLFIFGLGLGQSEVFLRWLLIERARYFKRFPERRHRAWYAVNSDELSPEKRYFLRSIDVTPVAVDGYAELYGAETWR